MPAPLISACGTGVIFYSLAALKNVGVGAIQHLIATREAGGRFTSLGDFARRMHGSVLNKRALESLAKAGAFDEINRQPGAGSGGR